MPSKKPRITCPECRLQTVRTDPITSPFKATRMWAASRWGGGARVELICSRCSHTWATTSAPAFVLWELTGAVRRAAGAEGVKLLQRPRIAEGAKSPGKTRARHFTPSGPEVEA